MSQASRQRSAARTPERRLAPGDRATSGDAGGAAILRHARFRRGRARLPRHHRARQGHASLGPDGLEPRALRLPVVGGSAADGQSQPVAAVAAQYAARPVRGRARRLPGARARHRQHDADRRRHRRYRVRHADLDRGRTRRDGALLPASRQEAGGGRDLQPHPHRPLGRRARRARRRDAGERQGADHRAELFHGTCGLRKHHRGTGDAAPRAISVRAVARQRRARAGRLRARQVDGGGLGGAVAADRSDHRHRRQARHRRRRVRIPDGAVHRGARGDAFLRAALQAAQPRGKLHAQLPQSAAVPRRRRARRAGLVEISQRGAEDVGRQGGGDVRPASLAGVGTRAHRHHDPPAARPLQVRA